MFGAIDVEPKEEKEKKVRQSRKSSAVDETMATQTAKTPKNTETGASLTEMLVNSTLMQLEDAYETNDRNPISYFNFVLDPQSFTKSVENMFHFSFLVKEGMFYNKRILAEKPPRIPYAHHYNPLLNTNHT